MKARALACMDGLNRREKKTFPSFQSHSFLFRNEGFHQCVVMYVASFNTGTEKNSPLLSEEIPERY